MVCCNVPEEEGVTARGGPSWCARERCVSRVLLVFRDFFFCSPTVRLSSSSAVAILTILSNSFSSGCTTMGVTGEVGMATTSGSLCRSPAISVMFGLSMSFRPLTIPSLVALPCCSRLEKMGFSFPRMVVRPPMCSSSSSSPFTLSSCEGTSLLLCVAWGGGVSGDTACVLASPGVILGDVTVSEDVSSDDSICVSGVMS